MEGAKEGKEDGDSLPLGRHSESALLLRQERLPFGMRDRVGRCEQWQLEFVAWCLPTVPTYVIQYRFYEWSTGGHEQHSTLNTCIVTWAIVMFLLLLLHHPLRYEKTWSLLA
jgi:hypothetical protein